MTPLVSLTSALLCVGGIGGLATQQTARLGNVLGMSGVGLGLLATMGSLNAPAPVMAGVLALLGGGAFAGKKIAEKVGPTELPQTVAAFHSLVGVAALGTAVRAGVRRGWTDRCDDCVVYVLRIKHPTASSPRTLINPLTAATTEFTHAQMGDASMYLGNPEVMDSVRMSAIYMASVIGSMTATGSVIAFGKLQGLLASKALALPGRDAINVGLALGTAARYGMRRRLPRGVSVRVGEGCLCLTTRKQIHRTIHSAVGFGMAGSPEAALACLGAGSALSGALCAHMTASIGGADMPVIVTTLNSYSGWALCAEGFMLGTPLLTIVGALIGSSGAILTHVMCKVRPDGCLSQSPPFLHFNH